MRFGAILFDCDGVLVDSEVVGLEDAAEFLRGNGIPWTARDLVTRFTGMRTDKYREGLRAAYDDALGRPSRDAEFDVLFEGVIDARRSQRHRMDIVPGAMETVRAAASLSRISLAVASSSAQIYLDDKIARYGFERFFAPHIYSADRVSRGKPAPDIFVYAAEQLGAAPADCLVIEDSPHGVAAGIAAEMTVWGFTGGGHCLEDHPARLQAEGAATVLQDHAALTAALSALSG